MIWRYAGASVTGTSHHGSGAGCQDAHRCQVLQDVAGEPVIVIVVSDGAGSATHGATGSAIVTTSIMGQASNWLTTNTVRSVDEAIVREWLNGIRENIAQEAETAGMEMRDYAATFLLAIVDDNHSIFAQVGDGAIVTSDQHGEWGHEFWPDRGTYANQTFFVTDDTVHAHLHVAHGLKPIKEVAVFTDGLERMLLDFTEHRAHAPAFEKMFQPLRSSSAEGAIMPLSDALARYLASPPVTSRTDDDVTLVIAGSA